MKKIITLAAVIALGSGVAMAQEERSVRFVDMDGEQNGTATLTAGQGQTLRLSMMGNQIMINGQAGSSAHVTQGDVRQSNGIVHVIDGVLTPSM